MFTSSILLTSSVVSSEPATLSSAGRCATNKATEASLVFYAISRTKYSIAQIVVEKHKIMFLSVRVCNKIQMTLIYLWPPLALITLLTQLDIDKTRLLQRYLVRVYSNQNLTTHTVTSSLELMCTLQSCCLIGIHKF